MGWPGFLVAAESGPAGLTDQRLATYRALVRALARSPGTKVDASRLSDAVAVFAEWYAAQDISVQKTVDAVLTNIEDEGGLSTLTPADARDVLLQWSKARTAQERAVERGWQASGADHPRDRDSWVRWLDDQARQIRENAEAIRAQFGADAFDFDPSTGLSKWQPPLASAPQLPAPDLSTSEAQRRFLVGQALVLGGLAFYEDRDDPTL